MKRITILVLTIGLMAITASSALGVGGYLTDFTTTYPATAATALNSCTLCHAGSPSGGNVNAFGNAYAASGYSFAAIAALDSDGDGYTNITEINANAFPGNAASVPVVAGDTIAPTVSTFTIPATATSLTVAVSTLTATDNVGVTGYLITANATAPTAATAGWSGTAPASYIFAAGTTSGAKTLYAWAKDAAGNVSLSRSAAVTITLPPADTTVPTVSTFTIPATASALLINITSIVATDNVGVTGYMVTESATKPAAGVAGWSATPPASYFFNSGGAKTLYAWAKDAAGNVSASRSAGTTITVSAQTHLASLSIYHDGTWYQDANGNSIWDGVQADKQINFGFKGATPVTGDWTGGGTNNAGVFADGYWYLDINGNGMWDGEPTDKIMNFGFKGAMPVVGDWTGSGAAKVGIFSDGYWYLDMNGNGMWDGEPTDKIIHFGFAGATPVAGDWTGSGVAKVGVFSDGYWYLDMNGNGTWDGEPTDKIVNFGFKGATPVVGDWSGSGAAKVGCFYDGYWYLDINGSGAWDGDLTDNMVHFGFAGATPVVK